MIRSALGLLLFAVGGLVSLVFALLALVFFFLGGSRMRWFAGWRELATRYGGVVDSWWWLPRMRLQWRGVPVVLRSQKKLDGTRLMGTVLESAAPEVAGNFSVRSRDWPAPVTSRRRAAGPAAGDGFDGMFDVQFHPATGPIRLPDAVRWQIQELAHWSGESPLHVQVKSQQIRIARPGYLTKPEALDDFLRLGLRLVDQLRTMETRGLEFVNEDQAILLDDAVCPICTDRIEGRMTLCVRCKTPHCRDCWEYNGKCGMFACNETRSTPVRE